MTNLYAKWPPHAYRFKTAFEWIDPLTAAAVENPLNPVKQLVSNAKGVFAKNNGPANAIASLPIPVPQTPITPANAEVLAAQQNYAKQTMGRHGSTRYTRGTRAATTRVSPVRRGTRWRELTWLSTYGTGTEASL